MKYLLLLLMLAVFGGCAGPQLINEPGLPNHMYFGGVEEIKYMAHFTRYYTVPEGNEELGMFEFLPIEPTVLKNDTTGLVLTAKVFNLKKQTYTMWEIADVHLEGEKYPYRIVRQLYGGQLSNNEFVRQLPLGSEIKSVTYWLEAYKEPMRDRNGEAMLFEIGPISYRLSRGGGSAK